jgi:Flp pilus assembly protein TadD
LRDFTRAADLNPLSSIPGRLAGAIALTSGQNTVAAQRFRQSIDREPGGWFAWLGAGLAASADGDRAAARHDYQVAVSINSRQPAIRQALARVDSQHPLTSDQAFKLLVVD